MTGTPSVAALIPAHNEAETIAATIEAVGRIPEVTTVVVVDDGSDDDTYERAVAAGAIVVKHARNRGKAAAMTSGAEHARTLDPRGIVLFVDADLQESATELAPLIRPILAKEADLAIAVLPPQPGGGGRGRIVRYAQGRIADLTGWRPQQPMSGMRCMTAEAFQAVSPLANRWGVEVAMCVDAKRAGLDIVEVPCDLQHRVSGASWTGIRHRLSQGRDVFWSLLIRRWK